MSFFEGFEKIHICKDIWIYYLQNAVWLEQFSCYRNKLVAWQTRMSLVFSKCVAQSNVLKKGKMRGVQVIKPNIIESNPKLLLYEARCAKMYWHEISKQINGRVQFQTRNVLSRDPGNLLLNIGYHWLKNEMVKMLDTLNMPSSLGLIHKARKMNSTPLVYDLIDPWRPYAVDMVWLQYFRQKKRFVHSIEQKQIAIFVSRLKKNFNTLYYQKSLKKCVSLQEWINIELKKFYRCVPRNDACELHLPSLRHESRCLLTNR